MLRPKHHLYLHVISAQNTVGYFRVTFQPPMPSRPWFYWLFGEAFKECRGIPSILLNQFKIPQRILNILHLLLWTLFHLWVLFLGLIIIHAHVQTYLIIKRLFYSHLFFPIRSADIICFDILIQQILSQQITRISTARTQKSAIYTVIIEFSAPMPQYFLYDTSTGTYPPAGTAPPGSRGL